MPVTPIRLWLLSGTNQIVVSKGACEVIAPALEWASLVLTYLKPLKKGTVNCFLQTVLIIVIVSIPYSRF